MRVSSTNAARATPESASSSAQAATGTKVFTTMATSIVMMRNAVPQRTCRRENLAALAGVSDRPCSKQWMVRCSAPW